MDGRNQLTTNLEGTDHGQVEVLVTNSRIETTNQVGLHAHDLTIASINLAGRHTVSIIVTGIFHLDHTQVSTGLQNIEVGLAVSTSLNIALVPQALVLIVIDHIDRIANEPKVTFITVRT